MSLISFISKLFAKSKTDNLHNLQTSRTSHEIESSQSDASVVDSVPANNEQGESEDSKETSFDLLVKKSEEGIAMYQTDLANCYLYGLLNTPIDIPRGLYWLNKAVEGNDPMGIHNLATLYLSGSYVERNIDKGLSLLKKSASMGLSRSLNDLGVLYAQNGDYATAAEYYERASCCKLNGGMALENLGMLYLNHRIPGGTEKGFECFQKAYDRDSVYGYYYLALCYYQGIGVEKNLRRSAELLIELKDKLKNTSETISTETRNRMEHGAHWLAMRFHVLSVQENRRNHHEMAKLYRSVAISFDVASIYYQDIAEDFSITDSGFAFFWLYDKVNSRITTPFLWYQKSRVSRLSSFVIRETTKMAENKDAEEMCNLGILYLFGMEDYNGVKGSPEDALKLFKESYAHGYEVAKYWMAICYDEGFGTSVYKDKAVHLFFEIIKTRALEQTTGNLFNPNQLMLDSFYRFANICIKSPENQKIAIAILLDLMKNHNHHFAALTLCKFACSNNYTIPDTDFDISIVIDNLKILKDNNVGEACILLGDIYETKGEPDLALDEYTNAFFLGQTHIIDKLESLNFWEKQPSII